MEKNIILFINAMRPATMDALSLHFEQTGEMFVPVILTNESVAARIYETNSQSTVNESVIRYECNFDDLDSVRRIISPIFGKIRGVTCQYENSIYDFSKILPLLGGLNVPSSVSLTAATDKKIMRDALKDFDDKLVPRYRYLESYDDTIIESISDEMTFPLIVKPSALEGSLLVTRVGNADELHRVARETFSSMQASYDKWVKRQKPSILIEEFMSGVMYSIDVYIGTDGSKYFAPIVKVVTGADVGFDDFFGYKQMCPVDISADDLTSARRAASAACDAAKLEFVTAHVEMMLTGDGWKIIEIAPRIGGYRHDLYMLSSGTNHIMNDILVRLGGVPDIRHEDKVAAAVKLYAKREGTITNIVGSHVLDELKQVARYRQDFRVGDVATFAEHGGDPVFEVFFQVDTPDELDQAIRTVESIVRIETSDN